MKTVFLASLLTVLSVSCAVAATSDAGCAALLPAMQEILALVREGTPLHQEEQDVWRTWNAFCMNATWQRQLAVLGPLPPPERPKAPPLPPVTQHLTWRDYLLAALRGFEAGATAPVGITRCETVARHGRLGTYCTSTTY